MSDHEFSMKPGDPATNSLVAEMVTRLTDAEEARFRELLAQAWCAGHASCVCACHVFGEKPCRGCWNPYQEAP